MKKIFLSLVIGFIAIINFISCTPSYNQSTKNNTDYDSVMVISVGNEYYQSWFSEFETKNPNWINENDGFKKLKNAFNNKMLNDLNFVKSVLKDASNYSSSIYSPTVMRSESITKYNNEKTGEYGEAKAFLMLLEFNLQNPMYNGDTEYSLWFEVINMIPSTEECHYKPYISNIDTCMQSKSLYFNNLNCSDEIVGSFIVGPIPDNK